MASSRDSLARRCIAVSVVIGAMPAVRQLDGRVPLLLGVEHRHMKLRMSLLDFDRGLLGGLVAFVLGLQLPIDGNMKRLGERWLDGFSTRTCDIVGDRRHYRPDSSRE